jgi:two-component system phosphate regulon sensor histidine kinase PhoR
MKINKQRCFIKPLIAKVLLAMKKLADEKGITVTVNVEPEAEKIYADEAGLGQVFYNLIENAIKYNIDRGKINITAVSKSNKVEIKISDSGVGIPEGDLPRIFERFYRVDKAHSRELGGTGLGLAIVKHIVQAHGGDIRLESREGEGTTFMILLDKA